MTWAEVEALQSPDVPFRNQFWMHLWIHGLYPPYIKSWSVHQEYRAKNIKVRMREWRLKWRRSQGDEVRKAEFMPEQSELRHLIQQGKDICVPIIGVKQHRGKDGALLGIVFEAPNAKHNDLYWWGRGPTEWEGLTSWHQQMTKFLDVEAKHARGE